MHIQPTAVAFQNQNTSTPLHARGEEGTREAEGEVSKAGPLARFLQVLVIFCLGFGFGAPLQANINEPRAFDIAPQPLSTALSEFARQSQQELLFTPEVVAEKTTSGVHGNLEPLAALNTLLQNTGLTYSTTPAGAILLKDTKNTTALRMRVSQSDNPSTDSTESVEKPVKLEEIVVTAQKRVERLQDVPVPVTALSAETLISSNQLRLQDYYSKIPGLNYTSRTQSAQILSIRGISTGAITAPTVGIMVDEVPYSTDLQVPDIDPGDLARIEVLRGPQGTLYGASSMGGLIKFVTVDPSMDRLSGRLQTGISSVSHGGDPGYNLRGSVNVPLSDTWAVRASAFTRRDPGYIDDPGLGAEDVNRVDANGGRLSALWRPSPAFSLRLSALIQEIEGKGSPQAYTGLAQLTQNNVLPGQGAFNRKAQAYGATVNAKLGKADLTVASGYIVNRAYDTFDISYALGGFAQAFGVTGASSITDSDTKAFTQEVRLSLPLGQKVEWLLGGYYSRLRGSFLQSVPAVNAATNAIAGNILLTDPLKPKTFEEYAGFTDLTFHVTDRFDIQAGVRKGRTKETTQVTATSGSLANNPATPIVGVPVNLTEDIPVTYLLTPRFKVSENLMVYARFASGYRKGSGNRPAQPGDLCVINHFPCNIDPDQTVNYEIGVKGNAFNHALSFDASLYHIDWKDMQTAQTQGAFNFSGNAGRAKSEGVELSVESRPLTGLTIATWVVYDNAVLKSFPFSTTIYGVAGDRLPFSTRFSGNFSVDQDFPLTSNMTGFAGASVAYVGDRIGTFRPTPVRQAYPSYVQADLRAGVRYDAWMANLYVNNIGDKRGVLSGGIGGSPPFAFTSIEPRTVGLSLSRTF